MKKYLLILTVLGLAISAHAKTINLPKPEMKSTASLTEALQKRHSSREFSPQKLSNQILSEVLFAAYGITHDKKHTIPTARNQQNLIIYVLLADGTYIYNPEKQTLESVNLMDLRRLTATQDYVKDAPVILVYAGENDPALPLHAGSAYQNVGLYAAVNGLNNIVRTGLSLQKLGTAIGLNEKQAVVATQVIGYPYK